MARERRPLSCDVWNRPWPPIYREGGGTPRPPETPFPDSPPEEPLPPATVENWLAVGLAGVISALLVVCAVTEAEGWIVLPFLPYFGLTAWGAFRVRPYREGRGVCLFWYTTVLLQLAVYLLAAWELVAVGMSDRPFDRRHQLFLFAASIQFVLGWIPTAVLLAFARRAQALLVIQILYPLLLLGVLALVMND